MAQGGSGEAQGPLSGVRVIDLTSVVLGPMGTQVLGDAGADVIKVETPQGDGVRQIGPRRSEAMGAYYLNLNRNKRSVALDLKRPAARAALLRLVQDADVFVHNMRLSAAERLGLDYASLRAINPRLIHASATGFRKGGPWQERPAYDDIVQGLSGLAALNRGPDGAPRYVPMVIADKICGLTLASAITMALYHRERTGAGQEVHVPMLETMLAFVLPEHMWGASINAPEQGIGYTRMLSPHRRPYATRDRHICVIAVTDDQWRRLLVAIGREDLVADPRFATTSARAQHIDTVYGTLAEALTTRSAAEWLELLEQVDIPAAPANRLEDLLEDPYLRETGFFHQATHPTEGGMTMPSPPVTFSATPTAIRHLPPRLGEHTESVLREAGLTEAEIAAAVKGEAG